MIAILIRLLIIALLFGSSSYYVWGALHGALPFSQDVYAKKQERPYDVVIREEVEQEAIALAAENFTVLPEVEGVSPQAPLPPLPEKVEHAVPFTSQAPSAQWDNLLYQDACEEASLLIAYGWVRGETGKIRKKDAEAALEQMFAFEQTKYGNALDTSAEDTARLMREYFGHNTVSVVEDPNLTQIMRALAQNQLVIVPADGRILENKHFAGEGPDRHMLVIIGYDTEKQEFITNDPGTRKGAGFRYSFENMMAAIRDYPTGHKEPIKEHRRMMIVVGR